VLLGLLLLLLLNQYYSLHKKNKNTVSSKSLILADFEYVILHKISKLLVYVSLLLQFVLGLATF